MSRQTYLPQGLPLPFTGDFDTRDWWAFAGKHKLVFQQCSACRTFRHPPKPICFNCGSFQFVWEPVSGFGTIYSFVIVHHPAHPNLKERVPYNIVVVEVEGTNGLRVAGNLINVDGQDIKIGTKVCATWEDISDGVALLQWVTAEQSLGNQ